MKLFPADTYHPFCLLYNNLDSDDSVIFFDRIMEEVPLARSVWSSLVPHSSNVSVWKTSSEVNEARDDVLALGFSHFDSMLDRAQAKEATMISRSNLTESPRRS